MRFVIDRFEEGAAVCEGLGTVPRELLPQDAQEGDVLLVERHAQTVTWRLDLAERQKKLEALAALRKRLTPAGSDSFEI